jgi:hypothetical protein
MAGFIIGVAIGMPVSRAERENRFTGLPGMRIMRVLPGIVPCASFKKH